MQDQSALIDLSHEEARVYSFARGHKVEIEMPASMTVSDSGEHLITDVTGVGSVIPPGWSEITIYPLPGKHPFG